MNRLAGWPWLAADVGAVGVNDERHAFKPAGPGWDLSRIAGARDRLMNRLGCPRYGAQGGDWGARVTIELARRHPASLAGRATTSPTGNETPSKPSPATARKAGATSRSSPPARRAPATAWSTPRRRSPRGSPRSTRRGATTTATPPACSPRRRCPTTSCCTGCPPPGPQRPGSTGKPQVTLFTMRRDRRPVLDAASLPALTGAAQQLLDDFRVLFRAGGDESRHVGRAFSPDLELLARRERPLHG